MATYKIQNATKFNEYSEIQQRLFEAFREAQLVLFVKWNGETYDEDDLELTEKSAFVYVDNYPMDLIEQMVDEKVQTALASAQTTTT